MTTLLEELEQYIPVCEQETEDRAEMIRWLRSCPDTVFTRQNRAAHFTGSGLVVNPSLDQALLIYHRIYDAWTWTGGHADGDSDLLRVALREAEEETGLGDTTPLDGNIATLDILPVAGHIKKGRYVSAHLHLSVGYLLMTRDDRPPVGKRDENRGAMWVPVEEIPLRATERHMQPLYRKLLDRLAVLRVKNE